MEEKEPEDKEEKIEEADAAVGVQSLQPPLSEGS